MARVFWLLKRTAFLMLVLIMSSTILFLLIHLTPGDPATQLLGAHASDSVIAEFRSQHGLDKPIFVQYLDYLKRLMVGDLGDSLFFQQPVTSVIIERLAPSLWIIGIGFLISCLISIPLAIFGAL